MLDATASHIEIPHKKAAEPFLSRIRIRNYKSISKCDVSLGSVTVLVGRNGSGKSNFLDAIRFVVDALVSSLDHAIKSRGGIEAVRRRSTGHPRNFAISFDMNLPEWRNSTYGFEVAARQQGGFIIKRERLHLRNARNEIEAQYEVEDGQLKVHSVESMPPVSPDRLYLVNAAGLPIFRPVYDALVSVGFYNLVPEAMKELQSPDAGELLHRDGSNIASVMARLSDTKPKIKDRIKAYLETIVPGISEVDRIPLGPRETLQFRQRVVGSQHPWKFYAASMSDGTLRALGILVAVMQLAERRNPVSFVGIEEPETALHPAAAGALIDALREAASHTQVVITSHSPDLLDQVNPANDTLLVVASEEGNTRIAPVDSASHQAIKKHLYSPGDLLRMDQLQPDEADLSRQDQMTLFDMSPDDMADDEEEEH
jgi:predicted ATPase